MMDCAPPPPSKRALDVALATLALVFAAPILAGIAVLIRITMGRPVLFRQERPGKDGGLFTLYKFRTMSEAFDGDGNLLPDSQRLTRLGLLLRSTSLDELPELLNVLKGEMSLVGPRPLSVKYISKYTDEQMRRHRMQPGITGWAQVHGRNDVSWQRRFELDVWYVDNWSLWLDLWILLRTIPSVVRRRGVAPGGTAQRTSFHEEI